MKAPMGDNSEQSENLFTAPASTAGFRIALMGAEGSGKTCFFAGLAWLGRARNDSGFGLVGRDEKSRNFVTRLRDTLAQGVPPQSTTDTLKLSLDVLHGGMRVGIDVADYSGEEFRAAGRECRSDQPVFKRLLASQYLLLFLDIEKDVEGGSASVDDRLDAALNLLSDERLCDGKRKLAVLLTKSDMRGFTGEDATPAVARAYLAEKQPALLKKIAELGYETEFFFLASLGRSDLDVDHLPVPFGYERLFGWIVKKRKGFRERFWGWCRKHPVLAIAGIVFAAALATWTCNEVKRVRAEHVVTNPDASKEEKEKAMRDVSMETKDTRADQLVSDIVGNVEFLDDFESLDKEWTRLDLYDRQCSGPVQGRIDECRETLKRRREELHLRLISDLEKRGESFEKDCLRAIADYREEVFNGKTGRERSGEIDAVEKRLAKNDLERRKAEIRASVPVAGKLYTLQERCSLVDDFPFDKFPGLAADKKDAKRAVEIGRRLCDGRPFHLVVYKGNKWLAKARRTYLEVSITGKDFPGKTDLQDTVEPQWEKVIKEFPWTPGDKIKIQWVWDAPLWKCGFTTTVLAKRTFQDPWTALLDILGESELEDTGNADSVRAPRSGVPMVSIKCDEFNDPATDLLLFKKFICPGTYWR